MKHPNTSEFIQYLNKIIPELSKPYLEMAKAASNEKILPPNSHKRIFMDFVSVGYYLASLDNRISENAANCMTEIGKFLVENLVASDSDKIPIWGNEFDGNRGEIIFEKVKKNPKKFQNFIIPIFVWSLLDYDRKHKTNYMHKAKEMYLRYATIIANADGSISNKKSTALSKYEYALDHIELLSDAHPGKNAHQVWEELLGSYVDELYELKQLIGLERVKQEVTELVNLTKLQRKRGALGKKNQSLSYHLVFYGNPGTGKTTVARIISQFYKSLGILRKGHFIETDRSGLVGKYIGDTALKVREVVDKAIGGVLFIDEAYSLSRSHDNDFGREAIDTLIKLMEDKRDDLVVIVAGYTEKMKEFLKSNPGLESRFTQYLHFDDYTPEQLTQIFNSFCEDDDYKMSPSAVNDLKDLFSSLYEKRDETFGNGRLARNIFQKAITKHANRVSSIHSSDNEILSIIEKQDIPSIEEIGAIK